METKNLENKLKETQDILLSLERLKTDIKFISNKEEDYFEEIIKQSDFFYRTYQNSIKLFVIDICKLLNPTEHFSILKTLNFTLSNRNKIKWKRELTIEKIKKLKLKVEVLISEHLDDFKKLRDKHFAHNDKRKFELEYNITLEKCWKTLNEIQEVFFELNLCLLNKQFIFSLSTVKPKELFALSKYKEIKEFIMTELRKSPNIGKLQTVRNIILGKKPA